jgi:hypothetical protein
VCDVVIEVADRCSFILQFHNGGFKSGTGTWLDPKRKRRLRIIGRDREITPERSV